MKSEEVMKAIEVLRGMDVDVPPTQIDVSNSEWAIEAAIEALEKQIPKKLANKDFYRGFHCQCGEKVHFANQEYCDDCGQKLDWRNNNEEI